MPTFAGDEAPIEAPTLGSRARDVIDRLRNERYPWVFVIFTGGILLALSAAPAPWVQIGLLSVLGMVMEYTRRGKIRP